MKVNVCLTDDQVRNCLCNPTSLERIYSESNLVELIALDPKGGELWLVGLKEGETLLEGL